MSAGFQYQSTLRAGVTSCGQEIFTLRDHLNGLAKRTPCLAINSMCMSSGNDIRSGLVDLRMDDEARLVDDGLVSALGDIAGAVDED